MESCAQIAGACLEQTTWLRRNLAVREEEPAITVGTKEKEGSGGLILHVQIYLLVTIILLTTVHALWKNFKKILGMKCPLSLCSSFEYFNLNIN